MGSFNSEDYRIASKCDVVTAKLDHKNQTILDRRMKIILVQSKILY